MSPRAPYRCRALSCIPRRQRHDEIWEAAAYQWRTHLFHPGVSVSPCTMGASSHSPSFAGEEICQGATGVHQAATQACSSPTLHQAYRTLPSFCTRWLSSFSHLADSADCDAKGDHEEPKVGPRWRFCFRAWFLMPSPGASQGQPGFKCPSSNAGVNNDPPPITRWVLLLNHAQFQNNSPGDYLWPPSN